MKFTLFLSVFLLVGCAYSVNTETINMDDQRIISARWNKAAQADYFPQWSNLSDLEILKNVRALPYRADAVGADFWQDASKTAKIGGDCEDKTILLYRELKAAGYRNMRVVVALATGQAHMVLVKYVDGELMVYDTINPSGRPYRASHAKYIPVYEIEADTGKVGLMQGWQ